LTIPHFGQFLIPVKEFFVKRIDQSDLNQWLWENEISMICENCQIEMENAGYMNANSKDTIFLVTYWKCSKCKTQKSSQRNVSK